MSQRLAPDAVWPPTDRDGRASPRRFNVLTWLRALGPAFYRCFDKQVPDEMWSEDVDDDGDPIAVVACVCKEEARVHYGAMSECSCGRWFLWIADRIKVARFEDDDES